MENKKLLTIIIFLFIVLTLGVVVWRSKNKKNISSQVKVIQLNTPIFFYGNTCPHCADVEEWMKKNDIEKKVEIIKKEVYDNQENAQELTRASEKCGLPTDSIGVPFLFAEGKCLIGTPGIISFLSQKAGITESTNSAERSEK